MSIGLPDTLAYYTEQEFAQGFKKTMAFQPRVIKQNRGSSGEGIWIVKLKAQNYCAEYGQRCVEDAEVLTLMEANDNHEEEHTVAEFIEFCVNGRNDKSGKWSSKGVGKYLEGGKEAGGQLVDQRFCPRIVEGPCACLGVRVYMCAHAEWYEGSVRKLHCTEYHRAYLQPPACSQMTSQNTAGELRYNLIVDTLVGIIHKKPKEGGISAVGGTGSVYTYFGPDEVQYQGLTRNFLEKDLPLVMPALGLPEEPIPLWWTTDFINSSPAGTPPENEKWIVGEFNCSCVGISRCLAAYCKDDTPNASYDDITAEDKAEADRYGKLMGEKALAILSKT